LVPQVKESLIRDTILLVDPVPFDRDAIVPVLERRLTKRSAKALIHEAGEGGAGGYLNRDFHAILKGRVPRACGEPPRNPGAYEMICPNSARYQAIVKVKRKYIRG
jgi:hypothetical protein